ncbi:MAG: hypothetical protein WD627_01480 [Actinomycetota bacterium]
MKTLALILLSLLLGACARSDSGNPETGTPPSIESKGPDDVVLRVDTGGGFVPVEVNLADIPEFSLYGDGRVITQGPQIMIYPGPALPNLLVREIAQAGVTEILKAAQKAGLTGSNRNFDQAANVVTDMPTTTFTLSTDDGTHETSAYGFDFLREVENLSDKDREAIDALFEFQSFIQDLEGRLPEGSVGKEESYEPRQMRVHATERVTQPAEEPTGEQPAETPAETPEEPAIEPPVEELPQEPVAWPLPAPLSEFGQPSQPESYRCGTVEGADLDLLLTAAQKANQLSPWTSGDKTYTVILRPLLPDETGCP